MRKISHSLCLHDGSIVREQRDMKKLLNYNILNLLNRAERTGSLDMPVLYCDTDVFPDFLALYDEKSLYSHTSRTAVCFYQYDVEFDGKNGLFCAIYNNDKARLAYFRERFRGVHYFIAPDYSVFGDIHEIENLYRIWKARIVALWFTLEMNAVVIPNISYGKEENFPLYFSGLEECHVIAFSTKSHIRSARESNLLMAAVRYAVDHLSLKAIVVYSVCSNENTSMELFRYAEEHEVKIIIPENTLHIRNVNGRCG